VSVPLWDGPERRRGSAQAPTTFADG
jgi:hypothetical protein